MSTDYVFVGPSLPTGEVARLLPGGQILPPVRHGDLMRIRPSAGDRVLLIDGLFLQSAPVRHKEILLLLAQGVTVAGASSMGALRAAELWRYGMRGAGDVFRLYRDLVITGDDEVAVTHGPAEAGYRALSEPLVNIRIALREACAAGAITAGEETRLLAVARALPFRSRGYRMLGQRAREELGPEPAARFAAWRLAHARDAKADDARLLLRMAAKDQALRPAGPGDTPIRHAANSLTDRWALTFRGAGAGPEWVSDADALVAIILLHSGFPGRHRLDVLARVGGTTWNDPRATERALAAARSRGVDERSAAVPDGWLTAADRRGTSADEQLARLLTRAFGTCGEERISPLSGGSLLTDEAVREWGRHVARQARQCNWLIPASGGRRRHYRDEAIDRAFAQAWRCPLSEIEAAVWDRGIRSMPAFRRLAEPFVSYLKAGGPLTPPAAVEGRC